MYAEPVLSDDPAACQFYHRMDIPGHGEVGDQWDLRAVVDDYLGRVDFAGKRVLDVGAASGYLTFEMERRGAEVVSFDIGDGAKWNVVPYYDQRERPDEIRAYYTEQNLRLRNAYWFAHRRMKSNARVFYGDIYDLPDELGTFDVVFFGMILGHLRDPFQALHSATRLCTGTTIICNQTSKYDRGDEPYASFIPNLENRAREAWWALSIGCLTNMLGILGFEVARTVSCKPQCLVPGRVQKEHCSAIVAEHVSS